MPPCARRSPVWSNSEVLDLISVIREEAVQSQLRSSHRNYNTFGQISRDMMERGHDQDALQCRVKVKELRNAYCKAREANSCSGAAPATCHFYKKLDAILRGDPTSTPSTTMDTSEPSSTRQGEEEEEQSRSEGSEAEEDTPVSLDACSQELFSSQEEGSQSWQPVLGEGQTPEEVPDATLRSQPSVLSLAKRLQRIRKRPRRSKEDMLHEVMQHSSNENQKVQEWRDSERRIRQQNEKCWHKSVVLRQQSTDQLISIMVHQADSIQALIAMQAEHYRARSPCPKTLSLVPPCHLQPTFPNIQVLTTTSCLQHL
nr:zinc finger protein with KRAB and SCAN domains 2-like [Caretta caretta]